MTMKAGGVIETGNPELDKKLGGGIPVGSLIFIEGESDAGKSVFTQQLTWGSLRLGYRVTLLSTENTVKSMIRHTASLNLDILDHLLLGKLKIFQLKAMRAQDGADHALAALLTAMEKQWEQDLVVVDSITSFVAHSTPEQVIAVFEECKQYTDPGMTVALVAHSYAFNDGMTVRISSMCDAHFKLAIENMGDKLIKTLEVAKVRGASMST
ncbi:MAG: ATPase domain-containing protein, partial [Dehalococcoidia bacterium]